MGDLSEHFSRREFDCHNGAVAHPDPELVQRLERLRHLCGDRPLRIVSGYRTAAYNRSIGGAQHSQHVLNKAADIPAGYATVQQARDAGFHGIGYCDGWAVHLDVRDNSQLPFRDC